MTRDEAIMVLAEAASNWLVELDSCIVPASIDANDGCAEGYQDQADAMSEALLVYMAQFN